jgi:hypothetical protein
MQQWEGCGEVLAPRNLNEGRLVDLILLQSNVLSPHSISLPLYNLAREGARSRSALIVVAPGCRSIARLKNQKERRVDESKPSGRGACPYRFPASEVRRILRLS